MKFIISILFTLVVNTSLEKIALDYKYCLLPAIIYLLSAVISISIAKRLSLGSVLSYLMARVIFGPFVLVLAANSNDQEVMHFSEFGIMILLFLIDLELCPSMLWKLRMQIFGIGTIIIYLRKIDREIFY